MGSIRNDITGFLCWGKKILLDYHLRHQFEGGNSEGRKCNEEGIAVPREGKWCPAGEQGS